MDADLQPVASALDDSKDAELRALREALKELLLAAPGMASWVERVAEWEINQRTDPDFPRRPLDATVPT